MPFAFVEQQISEGKIFLIEGDDAHHISRSLRLAVGDWVNLADGRGDVFRCKIVAITSKVVKAVAETKLPRRPEKNRPTLAIAVVKKQGIEEIIDHAVELGTCSIIPFFSSRSVPRYSDAKLQSLMRRWQLIALSAAKQSGLPFKPQIQTPCSFEELVSQFKNFTSTVLLWEKEDKKPLWGVELTQRPLLIIGPEGGFSEDEAQKALANGAVSATLGKQILRVDTAAIAALSIWGQMRGGID